MNKKILLADDHYIVTFGTSMLLKNHFSDVSIECAENYDEVKEKIRSERFDLIILDIEMPGSTFKFMVKELKRIQEDLMILIFSSAKESAALEYIHEGAEGFINKLCSEKALIKAVESIFDQGYYYPSKLIDQAFNRSKKNGTEVLSERELQVFRLLVQGNGNLEISNILNINISTVSTYKRRIYAKLGVKNIIDLLKIYNDSN
ncbi:DNA-binding response regulator [Chryseobacterium glaciei]|uniref:DNA-binding response regulator n=1 Tax=Chryseobacterium glaciei TaxID=1685010 RepID=A0A172XQ42_9FLAO|nr:response regulator transcription factor [Chryseobacterium glaciei]ANF49108.1 DNA-binding response regulator [Chryseobacterium glaciei]